MKQNLRFIQQFPVEKNNQQNYTEILNMTILQTIYSILLKRVIRTFPTAGTWAKHSSRNNFQTKLKLIFTRKINYKTRLR